jgi:hypothetical protein
MTVNKSVGELSRRSKSAAIQSTVCPSLQRIAQGEDYHKGQVGYLVCI